MKENEGLIIPTIRGTFHPETGGSVLINTQFPTRKCVKGIKQDNDS